MNPPTVRGGFGELFNTKHTLHNAQAKLQEEEGRERAGLPSMITFSLLFCGPAGAETTI